MRKQFQDKRKLFRRYLHIAEHEQDRYGKQDMYH